MFERPYAELFDPQYGSPLYPGVELTDNFRIQQQPVTDVHLDVDIEDTDPRGDPDLSGVSSLSELASRMGVQNLDEFEITRSDVSTPESVNLEIKRPQQKRPEFPLQALPNEIIRSITSIGETAEEWTPSGAEWSDPGEFFRETAEYFDPIQGAVANCYLIAAMSAVAWAQPYQIKHQTRATGANQQDFVDMIEFNDGGSTATVEVSEALPLRNGNAMYARSSEDNEFWPGVLEKAYAKWTTGVGSDKPDITSTAFGDPVHAIKELVGGSKSYTGTSGTAANSLWSEVRSNSRSYKTFNPGTAWTYSSAAAAPSDINYSDANVVANHAYTVLGWDYDGEERYILLRNPWGRTEPTVGRMNGVWTPYDESFWRRLDLPANSRPATRGSFAITAATFKQYFAGLGFVS